MPMRVVTTITGERKQGREKGRWRGWKRDEDWNGSGNGGENKGEGGEEREPGNLQSDSRRSEDARDGATPACNQQPQAQESTP